MIRMCYYLQPGKRKAKKMLKLWTEGATSQNRVCRVDERLTNLLSDYTPVFYGVAESTIGIFNKAVRNNKPWLYLDNQYFGAKTGRMYRITWSALQHTGNGNTNDRRLKSCYGGKLPLLKKWKRDGKHILITLQSELYFDLLMPYSRKEWLNHVVKTLRSYTDRPIVVREKPHPSRPYAQTVPFGIHLHGCYALVTLNSATAIEATMLGIPIFVTDQSCAIIPVANQYLSEIEKPKFFDRMEWLSVLANNQWSPQELRSGLALRDLFRQKEVPVPKDIIQRSYKISDIG